MWAKKQSKTELFETTPVFRALTVMAVPTIISQLIVLIYNLADTWFIGQTDDPYMVAAAALVSTVFLMITGLSNLFGVGGGNLVVQLLGRRQEDEARRAASLSLVMAAGSALVFSLLCLAFMDPLLYLLGASENTIEYAVDYMMIYALGTIFVQLTLGMNAFITAQGFASIGMWTVLIGAVINIALDPLFIFGLHMGVRGAALATVISQSVSCAWVLRFLTGKKTLLRLKKETLFRNFKLVLPCIALGSAAFIMQSSESVISVCFNSSLLKYGGDVAVGAMTILTSVMQFAMLPLQGIAQGAQPITSYNYGARNTARVRETFRKLLIACLTYSVLLWGFIQLFPGAFASMFTTDAELLAFTTRALRIYCGALFIFGLQIACQMTFVSIGNAGCSIVVAVLRKFVLLIPLIYILPTFLPDKTTAVYLAEPVADAIAVTCTAFLFAWQFKKALRKLEQPAPVQEKET